MLKRAGRNGSNHVRWGLENGRKAREPRTKLNKSGNLQILSLQEAYVSWRVHLGPHPETESLAAGLETLGPAASHSYAAQKKLKLRIATI